MCGCALNGKPDGGGGIDSSSNAGGMYIGCGGMITDLPQPNFISYIITSLPIYTHSVETVYNSIMNITNHLNSSRRVHHLFGS